MNEELKKFADSLQHARQGIQIGLATMAKSREELELLSLISGKLGFVVSQIHEYLDSHPTEMTKR